jgi:putative hydrolase of the HAD superfamily
MIKTIIFDLGRVLIPFDFNRGYKRLEALCSYPASDIPQRLRSTDLMNRFETGEVSSESFVREFSKTLGFEAGYDEVCDIWSCIFLPETLLPEEMIESLRKRYRVMLLSNTNALHYDMLEQQYPILKHFDHYVLSYKVGAMKPSPKIYEEALRHAEARPEECFYTDDVPAFVEAAKNLGIDAVVFEGREQIERELRSRGVEW